MEYKVTNTCIKIFDSYKIIDEDEMRKILSDVIVKYNFFHDRTVDSYIIEWKAHNLLYYLGLFKSHTKDVDLDDGETPFRLKCYKILSFIYDTFLVDLISDL